MNFDQNALSFQIKLTKKKLKELKQNGVKVLAFDWDGTIYKRGDANFGVFNRPMNLIRHITNQGITVVIITTRDASIKIEIVPDFLKFSTSNPKVNIFISGAQGANLSHIYNGKYKVLYSHGFSVEEATKIAEVYSSLNIIDGSEDSRNIFNKFLSRDWGSLVPLHFLSVSRKYNASIWAEPSKITGVIPKSKKRRQQIYEEMQERVSSFATVNLAGDEFVHVTPKMQRDGKVLAVWSVIKCMATDKYHLGTFGDSPNENDYGLLHEFPFSFTNRVDYKKSERDSPPFILTYGSSQIARTYEAVKYLTNKSLQVQLV